MFDSPKIWDLEEDIIIDMMITNPETARGLTGQVSYIALTIRRSDGQYWTGSAWTGTVTDLTVSETDSTNEPGRYNYTLDGATGNTTATTYYAYLSIDNPPTIEADGVEIHVSRDLVVRVYENEPV